MHQKLRYVRLAVAAHCGDNRRIHPRSSTTIAASGADSSSEICDKMRTARLRIAAWAQNTARRAPTAACTRNREVAAPSCMTVATARATPPAGESTRRASRRTRAIGAATPPRVQLRPVRPLREWQVLARSMEDVEQGLAYFARVPGDEGQLDLNRNVEPGDLGPTPLRRTLAVTSVWPRNAKYAEQPRNAMSLELLQAGRGRGERCHVPKERHHMRDVSQWKRTGRLRAVDLRHDSLAVLPKRHLPHLTVRAVANYTLMDLPAPFTASSPHPGPIVRNTTWHRETPARLQSGRRGTLEA